MSVPMNANVKRVFRHESLREADKVATHLTEIAEAIRSGTLHVSDDSGEIAFEPRGLVRFELTGSQHEGRGTISFTLSWRPSEDSHDTTLRISRSANGRPSRT